MKCNSITNINAGERKISPDELKVCELCGTLNHIRNRECFTCGWHGQFSRDRTILKFAWMRLVDQYEEVRPEHVTALNRGFIKDRGLASGTGAWRRFCAWVQSSWNRITLRAPVKGAFSSHSMHNYPVN